MMKCTCLVVLLFAILVTTDTAIGQNDLRTPSKFQTLNYLYRISGTSTITGIHNREPNDSPARWTNEVFASTGKYPGMWSGDFLFQAENIRDRQLMIDEAYRQWQKGALINIMWHACNPALQQPCGWDDKGVKSKLTDTQWKELITDGTPLNNRWKAMMDEVAGYLLFLKNKGVEVLWRPLHEMNQGVFWWGGRPGTDGTRRLWQITHDYMTKQKQLTNLVWVWDIQDFPSLAGDAVQYNPGDAYWDIAALDVYDDKTGYTKEKYDIMLKAAGNKPVAIGECQKYPTPEVLAVQPRWTFFMGWSELVFSANKKEAIEKVITAANTISLDEMPGWQNANAQKAIISTSLLNNKVVQFEKTEWDLRLSASFQNPYDQREIALDLLLTAPSGKTLVLPCYFDNGDSTASNWKARFAAAETGQYRYYFRLNKKGSQPENTNPATFTVQPGVKPGFLRTHNYYTFQFDNGSLFRGIGENVGWESRSFEGDKWTYDHLLPPLSKHGANFFRTWICPWNLPLETKKVNSTKRYINSDDYFHPGGIKRMEELLHMIDSLDLYMMLTLDMNSGNWNQSPYNQANGGPVKTYAEFFSQPAAMEKYKNKLRYVVARWGYSTHIAAWEFFNEIDNGIYTRNDSILIPHQYVTHWHQEMGRYLKDVDPYQHMVTTSISHRDILGLNSIPYIDFNQKHIYKHTGKIPAIYPAYIQTFGKPYVIGEFGYRWEDMDRRYVKEFNYDFKRGLWFGLFSPTPVLPMSWWWELFDEQNMPAYFKGVRIISDKMLQAGKGQFDPFAVTVNHFHAQAVQCGAVRFVYLLNESDEEHASAISIPVGSNGQYQVQRFDPATLQYKTIIGATMKNGQLTINKFSLPGKNETVLVITKN